jgi:hypothetical protein
VPEGEQLGDGPQAADQVSADEGTEALESHRALVREVNRKIGAIYGYGGAVAFGTAGASVGVLGWWQGYFSFLPWIAAIVVFLMAMLILRAVLARVADTEYDRLASYCEANDVSVERMREHYGGHTAFPYFEALFEIRERRAAVGRGSDGGAAGDDDPSFDDESAS